MAWIGIEAKLGLGLSLGIGLGLMVGVESGGRAEDELPPLTVSPILSYQVPSVGGLPVVAAGIGDPLAPPRRPLPNQPKPPVTYGPITVSNYQGLDLKDGVLSITGGAEMVYTDPVTKVKSTLTADSAEYVLATGLLTARKGARLDRTEGSFLADEIAFNLIKNTGTAINVIAETDNIRMRGERIDVLPDGSYLITNGVYTTCIRGRPDYQVRARRLSISANKIISARHATFYAGPTPLITIPTFRRKLDSRSDIPLPTPGFSKNEGLFFNVHDTPVLERRATVEFNTHFNFRNTPTGYVSYETDLATPAEHAPPPRTLRTALSDPLRGYLEQLTPPTYREYAEDRYEDEFAPRTTLGVAIQNNQFVYNRRHTDLRVSRFPEVSLHLVNLLGNAKDEEAMHEAISHVGNGAINPILQRTSSAPLLLDVGVNAGALYEYPTNSTAGRLSIQTNLATQPILLAKRISLRFAVTDWLNAYTNGNFLHLISPEAELDYLPTRTTRIGAAYRYTDDSGHSPFVFDTRDVRHELRLLFQAGGPVAFGIDTRFDIERARAYDTQVAVLRNLDCMQVGLAYRTRSQQFNIIFNLLPPLRDRATRRATPLEAIPGNNKPGS